MTHDLYTKVLEAFQLPLSCLATITAQGRTIERSACTRVQNAVDLKTSPCLSLELIAPALLGGMIRESHGDDGNVLISDRTDNVSKKHHGTSAVQPLEDHNSSHSSSRILLNGSQESLEEKQAVQKLDKICAQSGRIIDYNELQSLRKFPSVFNTIPEKLGQKRYAQFKKWITNNSLTAEIKDFEGTIEADDKLLKEAPEIDLPKNSLISSEKFVEIKDTEKPTFARSEKRATVQTEADYKMITPADKRSRTIIPALVKKKSKTGE